MHACRRLPFRTSLARVAVAALPLQDSTPRVGFSFAQIVLRLSRLTQHEISRGHGEERRWLVLFLILVRCECLIFSLQATILSSLLWAPDAKWAAVATFSNSKARRSCWTGRVVQAVLPKGEQLCIELLFHDGRMLVCTSDHRILKADSTWSTVTSHSSNSFIFSSSSSKCDLLVIAVISKDRDHCSPILATQWDRPLTPSCYDQ